jgi:hypothetical protein
VPILLLVMIMPFITCHFMCHWIFLRCHSIKFMSGLGGGGHGQICLPRPSATASLSGRRQNGQSSLYIYFILHYSRLSGSQHPYLESSEPDSHPAPSLPTKNVRPCYAKCFICGGKVVPCLFSEYIWSMRSSQILFS